MRLVWGGGAKFCSLDCVFFPCQKPLFLVLAADSAFPVLILGRAFFLNLSLLYPLEAEFNPDPAIMDLVASYLQQQKQQQQQSLFPLRSGRCENNDADSIVSAAMSSMATGAARALRKSRARAEQNVEGARAVT